MIRIGATASYVPTERLSAADYYAQGEISEADLEGLKSRGVTSVPIEPAASAEEMMIRTLHKLLEGSSIEPASVKWLLVPYLNYAFRYDDPVLERIKSRFDLSRATCFSLRDLLCSNTLMAIQLAARMLEAEADEQATALILCVEKCLLPDQRQGGGHFLTGDAAAALSLHAGTYGDKLLAFRAFSDVRTIQEGKMKNGQTEVPDYFYYVTLVKQIRQLLTDARIHHTDLSLIIPNNVTPETWPLLARLLKLPVERFELEGFTRYGHLNNCDIVLNLDRIRNSNRLKKDDYYILLTLGNGGVVCCALCQKG
ncbi:3-oxoacyl-[acyl-carrier-protein] synthase III C-terminal domain-containing protein [Marinicrinis sediminis]|uniref:3-oxoacyl-[acyl-carrier-protein] synthase III C-terminal domain-containing protein n=1 Tax=Marinicrinis sediminis TaxID=1652465 RepID=A0ABW5RE30_9BACL